MPIGDIVYSVSFDKEDKISIRHGVERYTPELYYYIKREPFRVEMLERWHQIFPHVTGYFESEEAALEGITNYHWTCPTVPYWIDKDYDRSWF